MTSEPRSIADELRGWPDDRLATLLRARPDLAIPVPTDLASLVARAGTRASVLSALERLDRFALHVLASMSCLTEPITVDDVSAAVGDDRNVAPTLVRLRTLALVWGHDQALRLVQTVRQVLGSAADGFGPPASTVLAGLGHRRLAGILADLDLPAAPDAASAAESVAALFADRDRLSRLLVAAPPRARELLDRLAGGPRGRVAGATREVRAATARTPVDWLLARALLVPVDDREVVLPREVGRHLRCGRPQRAVESEPPELAVTRHRPETVDQVAAGSAFTALRRVEDLLEMWGTDGPPVLRAGGLGVRDLRRYARHLDADDREVTLWAEAALGAGLVGTSSEIDSVWLPTAEYDVWRAAPPERRWVRLAAAWLTSGRVPGMAGGRDDRDRLIAPLGPGLSGRSARELRCAVLVELAGLAPGSAVAAGSLRERMGWRRPRQRGRLQGDLVDWTLHEAELLGVTGRGALSTPGRKLVGGLPADPTDDPAFKCLDPPATADLAAAAAALAPLLPTPLDHVLLQADLTAVAPGPLSAELARELTLSAEVESTGGATVYRFSESSIRRALDAGRTAAELHALLSSHSRTPVPQPLTYLIDDVARRHGRVRVGSATTYIRCDDAAALDEILADRRACGLRLRRLAPTVLAGEAPPDIVLQRLRDLGFAPAAESPAGDVVVSRPDQRRASESPWRAETIHEAPTPDKTTLWAAVRAVRVGDRAATSTRSVPVTASSNGSRPAGQVPRSGVAETLTTLRGAAGTGQHLSIGSVDNDGAASDRVVEPIRVKGGYLMAYDHRLEKVRTFAVHRITGVAVLDR